MSPSFHTLIPARRGLAAETADVLRRAIAEGRWVGRLPSERILCRETGVSRPKLREALAILENEKVLVTRDRARFIRSVNRRAANASRVVRLLTPLDFVEMQQHEQIWLDHLRGLLAAKDYQLQLLVKPALFKTRTRKVLESLGSDTACWLLHRSTRPLQQELVRSAVPVLVVGSVYEGIALNSVSYTHLTLPTICSV